MTSCSILKKKRVLIDNKNLYKEIRVLIGFEIPYFIPLSILSLINTLTKISKVE